MRKEQRKNKVSD